MLISSTVGKEINSSFAFCVLRCIIVVRDILGYQLLLFKNVIGGRSCPSVLSPLALLALLCGFDGRC
jgi:hypothetical protein